MLGHKTSLTKLKMTEIGIFTDNIKQNYRQKPQVFTNR